MAASESGPRMQQASISEFFEKNKHFLGFDSLTRSIITAVKESVDNSLDACEEAKIPPVIDIDDEPEYIKNLYGIGEEATDNYGRECLLARRFAEAGVRYIQVSTPNIWDQHEDLLKGHEQNSLAVDRPIAGLLIDLKQRGMLDDTLVLWGGEFGRTPIAEGANGRDHNPQGFTMWLAGGGVKGGYAYGETDEFGYYAVKDKVHMHDLHATILHLLGINHEKLTHRYAGRDFRLTDVHGHVAHDIIA